MIVTAMPGAVEIAVTPLFSTIIVHVATLENTTQGRRASIAQTEEPVTTAGPINIARGLTAMAALETASHAQAAALHAPAASTWARRAPVTPTPTEPALIAGPHAEQTSTSLVLSAAARPLSTPAVASIAKPIAAVAFILVPPAVGRAPRTRVLATSAVGA